MIIVAVEQLLLIICSELNEGQFIIEKQKLSRAYNKSINTMISWWKIIGEIHIVMYVRKKYKE